MRRGWRTKLVLWTTVVGVLMTLVVGGLGLGLGHTSARTGASVAASHPSAMAVHTPSAARPSAAGTTILLTTTISTFMVVPFNYQFNVTTSGWSIANTNTVIAVSITDIANVPSAFGGLRSCLSFGALAPCPQVNNISDSGQAAAGRTAFNVSINWTNLFASNYNGSVLPADQMIISTWVTWCNPACNAPSTNTTWGGGSAQTNLVVIKPWASLVTPISTVSLSTGNVTVGAMYGGDYITGASLSIYAKPSSGSGQLVYSNSIFLPAKVNRTVVAASPWVANTPGQYTVTITLTAPYAPGSWNLSSSLTVVPAGQTVYVNKSAYQNATLIPGLNAGTTGALLLVVGLIIGMIVALVLGRMMWSAPKPAPAQAWSGSSSGGTTGKNECPICHQTFDTEDAMKEHQKTAHGM